MTKEEFIQQFVNYASASIDEEGITPEPMLVGVENDGKLELEMTALLGLDHPQKLMHFCGTTVRKEVLWSIMGIDRHTRGTEFADVLTVFFFQRDDTSLDLRVRDQFTYAVLNYQHEPRIVRPLDWNNVFWNSQLERELSQYIPPLRITRKPK